MYRGEPLRSRGDCCLQVRKRRCEPVGARPDDRVHRLGLSQPLRSWRTDQAAVAACLPPVDSLTPLTVDLVTTVEPLLPNAAPPARKKPSGT